MTVTELIAALQQMVAYNDKSRRVVAEYDSGLYPVISIRERVVEQYPRYDLKEGEKVIEIVYADYE